ncbi:MAG: hypothetical protein V4530_00350 [Pseudomonadota bacterium]
MNHDARNSIYLWVGGLAFAGVIWAGLHFNVLGGVPDQWLWPLVAIVGVANIIQTAWGFWKRRASSSSKPNSNIG